MDYHIFAERDAGLRAQLLAAANDFQLILNALSHTPEPDGKPVSLDDLRRAVVQVGDWCAAWLGQGKDGAELWEAMLKTVLKLRIAA